jgi:hypothetical protein
MWDREDREGRQSKEKARGRQRGGIERGDRGRRQKGEKARKIKRKKARGQLELREGLEKNEGEDILYNF